LIAGKALMVAKKSASERAAKTETPARISSLFLAGWANFMARVFSSDSAAYSPFGMVKLSRTGLTFLGFAGFAGVTSGVGGVGGVWTALDEDFARFAAAVRLLAAGLGISVGLVGKGSVPCGLVRVVAIMPSLS
jgi:hypothetical protein